jgi:YD repeat-containing protein
MATTEANVTLGDTVFDRVVYDREADVLYLHAGDPKRAVEFDESPEGHALRYDAAGQLVGVTIVNARKLVEQDGGVSVTLPRPTWRIDGSAVAGALGLAS